jgi:hypothetical protein
MNTVDISKAKKIFGCGGTYRGGYARFGSCPVTCPALPAAAVDTAAWAIDERYTLEVVRSKPRRGHAWTFSHFAVSLWREVMGRTTGTVINHSAINAPAAAASTRSGVPAVTTVSASFWQGRKSRKVDGVTVVRCPEETGHVRGCGDCGGGAGPLCAIRDRRFIVGFTWHGGGASDRICYGNYWRTARAWDFGLSTGEDDSDCLREWFSTMPSNAYIRHHVVGDLGLI